MGNVLPFYENSIILCGNTRTFKSADNSSNCNLQTSNANPAGLNEEQLSSTSESRIKRVLTRSIQSPDSNTPPSLPHITQRSLTLKFHQSTPHERSPPIRISISLPRILLLPISSGMIPFPSTKARLICRIFQSEIEGFVGCFRELWVRVGSRDTGEMTIDVSTGLTWSS